MLARGVRAILLKQDGSVSIHNDKGNKPLNYMKEAVFSESIDENNEAVWTFDSRKESLSITIYKLISSTDQDLIVDDPGLVRDGTEDHLQEWLSHNPQALGKDFSLVQREFPTGNGPVDLLVNNGDNVPIAVEVKRVAMLSSVDQCRRYVEALKEEPDNAREVNELSDSLDFHETIGVIAAVDIRPKTLIHAEKKGIQTIWLPKNWRETTFA